MSEDAWRICASCQHKTTAIGAEPCASCIPVTPTSMSRWTGAALSAPAAPVAPHVEWLRALLGDVMDFHHTPEGMVRGGEYVRADALIDMAALRPAPAAPVAQPYLHVYEYETPFGLHREFYPRPYNGGNPTRTVALYAAPQPVSEPASRIGMLMKDPEFIARLQEERREVDESVAVAQAAEGFSHALELARDALINSGNAVMLKPRDLMDVRENTADLCRTAIAAIDAALRPAAPRAPLTDEQIDALRFAIPTKAVTQRDHEIARAIERAHGIGQGDA